MFFWTRCCNVRPGTWKRYEEYVRVLLVEVHALRADAVERREVARLPGFDFAGEQVEVLVAPFVLHVKQVLAVVSLPERTMALRPESAFAQHPRRA